jgi:hypothetical protein
MGKDSPSPPPAPDYRGAAIEQGVANLESARATAKLSNPNMYTPYGSQTVQYEGDVPTVTQTLSPESQKILEAQNTTKLGLSNLAQTGIGQAGQILNTPFAFGGPNVQTSLDTSQIAKMPVNAGTTGQEAIMSRLEPSLQRNRVSTETQLVNQGLRPGTEAYDNAIKVLGQQENDARTQAVLQGIGLDTGANTQGFNQQLQSGQFANTAQQQNLSQDILKRQLPINEITALMNGSQIANPQFGAYQGANVAPAPIANATAQTGAYNQNIYNQQVGSANANTAGLYSLGGAGLQAYGAMNAAPMMFSDRRLKSNIKRIGTHKLGIGIYEYDIMGKHEIGVMAQEVEQVMPEAIGRHQTGYMMVDYGRINA